LMAVALRHLYAVPHMAAVSGEPASGGAVVHDASAKQPSGSRYPFCAADPTRSISAIREHRTVPYDGSLRPKDVVAGLEKLAGRIEAMPDMAAVQATFGTFDYAGSRPLEAWMQAIRPLHNAQELFANAKVHGYVTAAPEVLEAQLAQLIGKRPKEQALAPAAMR
jgi:hypothetical protein